MTRSRCNMYSGVVVCHMAALPPHVVMGHSNITTVSYDASQLPLEATVVFPCCWMYFLVQNITKNTYTVRRFVCRAKKTTSLF